MNTPSRPAVLVLDAQTRQGLAVCRALGRAGFAVSAASADRSALARGSRWVSGFHPLPTQNVAHAVAALSAEHGYDLVVAAEDPTIAALRADPPGAATVPSLDDALEHLVDKILLGDHARAAGVAYPATLTLTDERSWQEALRELGSPLVVKARRSASVDAGEVAHRSGAKVAYDETDVGRAAAWVAAGGLAAIAQARVARVDKVNVTIVRRDGACEVRFPYRVLRDVPLTGGIAVSLETLSPSVGLGRAAVEALERVCATAGYQGVANGEFCVDADGRLTLIEINPRPWGSLWFAERLGQRVSERCARLALGQPPLPAAPEARSTRYHNLAGELRWARLHPRPLRVAARVLADLRPTHVFEYLDLSDPLPPFRLAVDKVRSRLRRAPRR